MSKKQKVSKNNPYKKCRLTWGEVDPSTKVQESIKKYKKRKLKNNKKFEDDDEEDEYQVY
jgi:hypothetical protein